MCIRVNEGCSVGCTERGVMKKRGLGMNIKVSYENVIVPTVMYGSES